MKIHNRIKELRKLNNLTQKELAAKIDLNYSVLSRIETGERPIRDDELFKIANYFKVTIDYLLGNSSKSATIESKNLLGKAPDPILVNEISSRLNEADGILGIHDLEVHDYGPGRIFASVHAEVDASSSMGFHAASDRPSLRRGPQLV